jgi:protein-L-isoaspartate O-methyltransferase
MEGFPDEIVQHYDHEIDEGQRITRGLGQLELLRTREIVRQHLPPAPSRVLDVGGGTGVHAAWLAEDGHDVHLVDRVPRHVEQVRGLAPRSGRITAEVGDARDLRAARASWFTTAFFHHPEELRAEVVDAEPSLLGLSGHLLVVARPTR